MTGPVSGTDDLPAAERFDHCRALMEPAPAPLEPVCADPAGFRMSQVDVTVDSLRVWTMEFAPVTFRRTERLIERSDPETYNVVLVRAGAMDRVAATGETAYGRGDLHVDDSSRPYELRARGAPTISCAGVEIPRALLPVPGDRADLLIGRRLSGRDGFGALLAGTLAQISADHGSYRPEDEPHLATVVCDLVAGLFARVVGEDADAVTPESRRRVLLQRVRSFIDQRLHDPELTPGVVAAAHHISTSYLHRLFQEDGVAVAAWIRRRRLERARRDLTDPVLSTVPVHHIAARCGFRHHAAFTRAFRTAYGVPPRDYRAAALATPG
ncbi:helix-turn-helix domain-containing protein [Saccharomonospora halophila]|uniref:helix-turn-helix domain-containing protein n=1 Tax=Saccharomonospora halophila TaxID=129922 RepID=UPI00036A38FD